MKNLLKISITLAVSFTASLAIGMPSSQAALAKCGKRDKLAEVLKERYKEVPIGLGISQKSTEAFEIYVSEKGTWTVTMTMSNGMTCVMAAGHSWQTLPKQFTGSGA